MLSQTTNTCIMVRPYGFAYDSETATTNSFQKPIASVSASDAQWNAQCEFDGLVTKMRAEGIKVLVIDDASRPLANAVFPNNWLSFHQHQSPVIYPMAHKSRQQERQLLSLIQDSISQHSQWDILAQQQSTQIVDLSPLEQQSIYLEGTGSMVLDRKNRLAYAGLSPRTHELALNQFCQVMNYEKFVFNTGTNDNNSIYHTNVMMSIGEHFAVVCLDAIPQPAQQSALIKKLEQSNKEIIVLSRAQIDKFAANILEMKNQAGQPYTIMSTSAYNAYTAQQRQTLSSYSTIIHSPLSFIEYLAGGSARCMIAELFFP